MSEELRSILYRAQIKLAQLKASLYDELVHDIEWHLADLDMDAQRTRGPIVATAPEAPPDAPTAPEPAAAAQPDPTPTPSADELLSPPVRRGRGRPRKVQPEAGAVPSPQPGPELESADIGADRASDDDFFAPAPEPATAQNDDADDAPDFLDGLD